MKQIQTSQNEATTKASKLRKDRKRLRQEELKRADKYRNKIQERENERFMRNQQKREEYVREVEQLESATPSDDLDSSRWSDYSDYENIRRRVSFILYPYE